MRLAAAEAELDRKRLAPLVVERVVIQVLANVVVALSTQSCAARPIMRLPWSYTDAATSRVLVLAARAEPDLEWVPVLAVTFERRQEIERRDVECERKLEDVVDKNARELAGLELVDLRLAPARVLHPELMEPISKICCDHPRRSRHFRTCGPTTAELACGRSRHAGDGCERPFGRAPTVPAPG